MSDDLVEFLRARLASDEHYATQAKGLLGIENAWWTWTALKERFPSLSRGDAQHIERHGPYRVLAEVEAKREVLRLAVQARRNADLPEPGFAVGPSGAAYFVSGFAAAMEHALRLFAQVYADHPDYRPEWAPDEESST